MQRVRDDFLEKRPKISHNNAVFCKEGLACPAWISDEIGSPNMSMPYLLIRLQQIQQRNICLIGIHAPPQVPIDASGMRPYIKKLIPFMSNGKVKKDWRVCKAGDSILMMGDLNAVPYSWAYEQIRNQGLIDPLSLSGIFGHTWPNGGGFIKFPLFRLDHIFMDPSLNDIVEVQKFTSIPNSDHLGLRVRIPFSSTTQ